MAGAVPFTNRIWKRFQKLLTFDGATIGLSGTPFTFGTVTGAVIIGFGHVFVNTTLVSAGGGSISLGCATNVAGLVNTTLATTLLANDFWQDPAPEFGISPSIQMQSVCQNLILTTTTANVTAGVIDIELFWLPASFTTPGSLA